MTEEQKYESYSHLKDDKLRKKLCFIKNILNNDKAMTDEPLLIPKGENTEKPFFYPNHGKTHIKTVIENVDSILKNIYTSDKTKLKIDDKNLYYLYLATLIHDLGMHDYFGDRAKHPEKVSSILNVKITKEESLFNEIGRNDLDTVIEIAAAHGACITDYEEWMNDDRSGINNENRDVMKPELIMILRIADILDITESRVHNDYMKFKERLKAGIHETSILHWLKHFAIMQWQPGISTQYNERTKIKLCVTERTITDLIEKDLDHNNFEYDRKYFIKFMADRIEEVREELLKVSVAARKGSVFLWPWDEIEICPQLDGVRDDMDFAKKITEQLEKTNQHSENRGSYEVDLPIAEEELHTETDLSKSLFGTDLVDYPIREELQQRSDSQSLRHSQSALPWKVLVTPTSEEDKAAYHKIAMEKELLKIGCRKHEHKRADGKVDNTIKLCDWLDTFAFHKDSNLLKESITAIAGDVSARKPDVIVGIGLKGARLASVVALITEKPILICKDYKVNIPDKFSIDSSSGYHRIAIITDCVITGHAVQDCIEELQAYFSGLQNGVAINADELQYDVYCIFLRVPIDYDVDKNDKNDNVLFKGKWKSKVKLYTINDSFRYRKCTIKVDACPIYQIYGDEIYDKSYKDRIIHSEMRR